MSNPGPLLDVKRSLGNRSIHCCNYWLWSLEPSSAHHGSCHEITNDWKSLCYIFKKVRSSKQFSEQVQVSAFY